MSALAQLELKEKVALGVGLSNNDYVSAMLLFKLNRLDFGYGYEMGQRTSSTALRANTHELVMRFRLGSNKAKTTQIK